jgi:hypothetical protein
MKRINGETIKTAWQTDLTTKYTKHTKWQIEKI